MAERYFNKFPTIIYANNICTNITRRVVVDKKYNNDPSNYHDFTLNNNIRADFFAERYYDDAYFDWLVYLNNGIVDPYYGWYLDDFEFNSHIIKKYGSIEQAQKKIIYYQLNWPTDQIEINVSYYENNLPNELKKYYTPNYGDNVKIISYSRKQDDFIVNTNKIVDLQITNSSGNGFVVGEIIDIANTANSIIGGGEVVFANTTIVKIKNISGNTSATNKLAGETSKTTANISASTILTGAENLSEDEFIYWAPVYYYEYERERNEENKNIRVIDSKFALEIADSLRVALRE
jgi:hypothetical protein